MRFFIALLAGILACSVAQAQNTSQTISLPVSQSNGGTSATSLSTASVTPTGGSPNTLAAIFSGGGGVPGFSITGTGSIATINISGNLGGVNPCVSDGNYGWNYENGTGEMDAISCYSGNISANNDAFVWWQAPVSGDLVKLMNVDKVGNFSNIGTITSTGLTASGQANALCYNSSTGLITYNSGVTTCLVSAERFKDIKRDIAPDEGLRIVLAAKPKDYVNNKDPHGDEVGLVCEQMQNVDRRLVSYDKEGHCSGVRYEQYAGGILTAAVQQLKHDNDDLRQQITDLRNAIAKPQKRGRRT